MDTVAETEAAARRLVDEYNRGQPGWVEACHAPDSQWTELPLFGGAGRGGGRAALRKAAEEAVAGFPDRRMRLIDVVAKPGKAALELEWTGSAAQASERFKAGERLTLRIVMMVETAGGRIVRQTDYCIVMPNA